MRAAFGSVAVVMTMLVLAGDLAGQEQIKPQPAPAPRDTAAPPPRGGTGLLSGTLVAADTGRPVRRAMVTLASPDSGVRKTATTDEAGAFSFTQLPAGSFTLSATRLGYLDVAFGQRTPGSGRPGTAIQLAAGQKLEDVTLRMPRTGILTGVITDEFGDPMMGMQVRAWRYVKRSGERTLQSAGGATTDDRGIYRITGLLPGEYIVGTGARDTSETMMLELMKMREVSVELTGQLYVDAKPNWSHEPIRGSAAAKSGYAAVYYPGTLQSSAAAPVRLGISEERSGVDMQLQVVPFAQVSGSVIGPDGGLPPGGEVRLVESGSTLPTARTFSGPVRADGTFTISGVPPGQYTLTARTSPKYQLHIVDHEGAMSVEGKSIVLNNFEFSRNAVKTPEGQNAPESLWGQMDLSVDGRPLTNVVVSLQRGFDVSGTFAFDGTPPLPPDLSRIRVQLTPVATVGVDAGAASSATYTAGRFTLKGVTPGRYRLSASGLPSGWMMQSAVFGGRDVLDTMLEVKPGDELSSGIVSFTSQSTELSGMLQDNSGKPVADYTIVVFASDRRYWTPMSRRIQAARPSTDGRFSFRNLPAGEYRLIAVVDPEPGEWFDPAFLDQVVGATMPVSLGEGERKVQDVRIVR
jgi:hypothetical protein